MRWTDIASRSGCEIGPSPGSTQVPPRRRGEARTRRLFQRLAATLLLAAAALATFGCERTEPTRAEREAIEEVVIAYLHDLARAYSSFDANELSAHATMREMVEVNDLLRQLAASGDRLQATMLQVEITEVEVFRAVNGTVKTVEVWDVARYDAYNGREKNRNPSLVQHATIQLRLVDDEWKVIGRSVIETQKGGAPADLGLETIPEETPPEEISADPEEAPSEEAPAGEVQPTGVDGGETGPAESAEDVE